jgi:LAO/AO transport system kinase
MDPAKSLPVQDRAESETGQVARLFAGLRGESSSGRTRALARTISLVENGAPEAEQLLRLCGEAVQSRATRALRIGITGPPGAGKSTLVDGLARELRRQGRSVGIVAVDPSSPFTGGAVLGDRIRLGDFSGDDGIFMRSMATRGHLGGLAKATEDVLTVMEAADRDSSGRDVLIIETTGVGQGEIEVVGLADVVALVLVPGMGDAVQSLKAGVLEIASAYVLNKADLEGIDRLEQEMQAMLGLAAAVAGDHSSDRTILKTVASSGEGVAELLAVLEGLPRTRPARLGIQSGAAKSEPKGPLLDRPVLDRPVLDHLGVAVRSIAEAQPLYAALGLAVSGMEEIPAEQVRVAMFAIGESRIELLEATEPGSPVGKFIAKRGEGLHHIALRVPDLKSAVERLKGQGIRLVSDTIQTGAGGHRYVFIHPASAHGVLLELVEGAH